MARRILAQPPVHNMNEAADPPPHESRIPLAERVSRVPNTHVPAGPANNGHAETCFVACKVGEAWIEMQLCERQRVWEQGQNGGKWTDINVKAGKIVRVRGTAYPNGQIPNGFAPRPQLTSGFAISAGIDRAFVEEWFRQYYLHPMVESNLIMWDTKAENLKARCREHKDLRSGLEPLIPRLKEGDKGDPRDPRPARSPDEQTPLQVEESKAKRMRSGTFGGDGDEAAA